VITVPIVLASASPRRLDLLRQLGVDPVVDPADVDETLAPGVDVSSAVLALARTKAATVAARHPGEDAVVLGADTLVVVDGRPLGKPLDDDEATTMLRALSGRSHQVVTGVAVVDPSSGRSTDGIALTTVRMRHIEPAEIATYVATGEPLDKAGGYAIQGRAATFVAFVSGSYSNVVGLPLFETAALLKASSS
jgi:septum formation protein